MSYNNYAEFNHTHTQPKISNPPNPHPWAFSVTWTSKPNAIGVNPPNPQFQQAEIIPYLLQQTNLPASTENGTLPVGLLQSKREPYAVDWYPGVYGSLESKLGTNMGASV